MVLIMAIKTIYIKTLKGRKVEVDKDFSELTPKESSITEFFNLYSNKFYEISKFHHEIIRDASIKYIGNPPNVKDEEILSLENMVKDLDYKIRSIPLDHTIFDNGKIIQQKEDQNQIYYIQSKKLRKIIGNKEAVINQIKLNNGFSSNTPDSVIMTPLEGEAINNFERSAHDITDVADLTNLSTAEVNRINNDEGGTP